MYLLYLAYQIFDLQPEIWSLNFIRKNCSKKLIYKKEIQFWHEIQRSDFWPHTSALRENILIVLKISQLALIKEILFL